MQSDICVAFGFDRNYVPHAAAVIASIVQHSGDVGFHFLILEEGVERALQETVEALAPQARFTWIDLASFALPAYTVTNHISRATLYRLGLEQLAPADCQRLIYLDADLIVTDNLRELWDIDLQGAPIGAVADCVCTSHEPDLQRHWLEWGVDPDGRYFNAGVLLVDLAKVRAEKGFTKALDLIAERGNALPYQDQDALNMVFWQRWHALPPKWNVQALQLVASYQRHLSEDMVLAGRRPGIVHYTGPSKPWSRKGHHPWWWLYWDALARTPFLNQVGAREHATRKELMWIWLRWLARRQASAFGLANFPLPLFKLKAAKG